METSSENICKCCGQFSTRNKLNLFDDPYKFGYLGSGTINIFTK